MTRQIATASACMLFLAAATILCRCGVGTASAVEPDGAGAAEEAVQGAEEKKGEEGGKRSVVLGVRDIGIFNDLDPLVSMDLYPGIDKDRLRLVISGDKGAMSLYSAGTPVKTYPVRAGAGMPTVGKDFRVCRVEDENLPPGSGPCRLLMGPASGKGDSCGPAAVQGGGIAQDPPAAAVAMRDMDIAELCGAVGPGAEVALADGAGADSHDADGDGIPDQVDILAGAIKCALNGDEYDSGYRKIAFPMGDVDRSKGCCTDVVIRAFRNSGTDLQKGISDDIDARKKAYKHIKAKNTSIDHRRVKNMFIYMKKHLKAVDAPLDEAHLAQWLPGDVVFLDTLPKKGPDHVGILSSRTDKNGFPMVINNWTWGSKTGEMDLLSWCPVTHHFRVK